MEETSTDGSAPAASRGCSATGGRPDGRGLTDALADRVRLLVLDGRLPLQTRMPAERELATALGVSRTTVAAAYEALRGAGMLHSRRGAGSWTQLATAHAGRAGCTPFSPHGTAPGIDLAHAALAAPVAGACARPPRRRPSTSTRCSGRARLRPARPPGAARRGRRPVHRARPADPAGPGAGHLRRRSTRSRWCSRRLSRPATGCSSSTRPTPTRSTPCAPAAPGRCRCRWARLAGTGRVGPRPAHRVGARRRAAPDVRHPRLPEPDRRRCSTPRGASGSWRWPGAPGTPLRDRRDARRADPRRAAAGARRRHSAAPDSTHVMTIGSAARCSGAGCGWGGSGRRRRSSGGSAPLRAALDLGGPVLEQLVAARLLADLDTVVAGRADRAGRGPRPPARPARRRPSRRWRPSRPTGGLSLWIDLGAPVSSGSSARPGGTRSCSPPARASGWTGAFERYLRAALHVRRDRVETALDRLVAAWHALDESHPTRARRRR